MSTKLMQAVDERSASALASGALLPIRAEQTEVIDAGMRFIVRWVSSLAAKDALKDAATVAQDTAEPAAAKPAMPGGPRDPNFNPFLAPEPALTVGPIGEHHTVILNKFPVCERHLVLARRVFEEQLLPLSRIDFLALAEVMSESGGLGFYNGGAAAGASQRHKHVQWVPQAEGNASLRVLAAGLPSGVPEQGVTVHPALPMRHCFVRTACTAGVPVEQMADSMHRAFVLACEELGLRPDAEGLLPPCNMLVGDGWLLLVPRSRELYEDIAVSAICYGGTLYVRRPEQIEVVRKVGPLQVLAAVGS